MYKHILLPTDGSELSKAAMRHGIALAKAIGAKVSALVVSTPLTSLVVDPTAASAALEQYKVLVATQTAKYLDSIRNEAAEAGVACSALCVEHDKPYEAIVDTAKKKRLRSGRHGLARAARSIGDPRQRNAESADPQRGSDPGLSLTMEA